MTKGSEALRVWVGRDASGVVRLAERLGVSRITLERWCTGAPKPDALERRRVESLTGIAPGDWDEHAHKPLSAEARTLGLFSAGKI